MITKQVLEGFMFIMMKKRMKECSIYHRSIEKILYSLERFRLHNEILSGQHDIENHKLSEKYLKAYKNGDWDMKDMKRLENKYKDKMPYTEEFYDDMLYNRMFYDFIMSLNLSIEEKEQIIYMEFEWEHWKALLHPDKVDQSRKMIEKVIKKVREEKQNVESNQNENIKEKEDMIIQKLKQDKMEMQEYYFKSMDKKIHSQSCSAFHQNSCTSRPLSGIVRLETADYYESFCNLNKDHNRVLHLTCYKSFHYAFSSSSSSSLCSSSNQCECGGIFSNWIRITPDLLSENNHHNFTNKQEIKIIIPTINNTNNNSCSSLSSPPRTQGLEYQIPSLLTVSSTVNGIQNLSQHAAQRLRQQKRKEKKKIRKQKQEDYKKQQCLLKQKEK